MTEPVSKSTHYKLPKEFNGLYIDQNQLVAELQSAKANVAGVMVSECDDGGREITVYRMKGAPVKNATLYKVLRKHTVNKPKTLNEVLDELPEKEKWDKIEKIVRQNFGNQIDLDKE